MVTVSDKKIGVDNNSDGQVDYYNADVITAQDYYPFGKIQPGRQYGTLSRYTFSGKEYDKETKTQDYGMRIYSQELGRFLSVDPLTKDYPHYTPYSYAGNKPIWFIDLDGGEEKKHWYHYDFNDLMNWLGSSENSLSNINNGKGPIGRQLDNFNKNINPIGIVGHGVYSTTTGKDLTTGESINRGTAFTNMGVNIIMTTVVGRLPGAVFTSQAEKEMASVTLKPKMQQAVLATTK